MACNCAQPTYTWAWYHPPRRHVRTIRAVGRIFLDLFPQDLGRGTTSANVSRPSSGPAGERGDEMGRMRGVLGIPRGFILMWLAWASNCCRVRLAASCTSLHIFINIWRGHLARCPRACLRCPGRARDALSAGRSGQGRVKQQGSERARHCHFSFVGGGSRAFSSPPATTTM